jgi:hypothetical protein
MMSLLLLAFDLGEHHPSPLRDGPPQVQLEYRRELERIVWSRDELTGAMWWVKETVRLGRR